MPIDPEEARRRAAALEAMRTTVSPRTPARSFWQQHGRRIAGGIALLLGLWLVARAVGSFMRHSVEETHRSEQELRRGMQR